MRAYCRPFDRKSKVDSKKYTLSNVSPVLAVKTTKIRFLCRKSANNVCSSRQNTNKHSTHIALVLVFAARPTICRPFDRAGKTVPKSYSITVVRWSNHRKTGQTL